MNAGSSLRPPLHASRWRVLNFCSQCPLLTSQAPGLFSQNKRDFPVWGTAFTSPRWEIHTHRPPHPSHSNQASSEKPRPARARALQLSHHSTELRLSTFGLYLSVSFSGRHNPQRPVGTASEADMECPGLVSGDMGEAQPARWDHTSTPCLPHAPPLPHPRREPRP